MRLFFQNYKRGIGVSSLNPLDSLLEQALDVFDNLPEDDGSFIGMVNEKSTRIQFSKYDAYNWIVDIPVLSKNGAYKMFLTKRKCKLIIRKIYRGFDPLKISGLCFEKFV